MAGAKSKIETISKEELTEKMEQGEEIQIVNVLEPRHYGLGSIQGSLHIPVAEIDERLDELDPDFEIITYCAGGDCHASLEGAQKLAEKGFKVRAYEGGIEEWKQAGLPLEEEAAM